MHTCMVSAVEYMGDLYEVRYGKRDWEIDKPNSSKKAFPPYLISSAHHSTARLIRGRDIYINAHIFFYIYIQTVVPIEEEK